MTSAPLISVILPVINEERLLSEAVACIRAQAAGDVEILVAHGSSTDRTGEVLERLQSEAGAPLRVLSTPGARPGAARNVAARVSRGRILTFLDADDLWAEGWLALVRARPIGAAPGILLGHTAVVRAVDVTRPERGWQLPGPPVLSFSFGAMALRRETFDAIGGVDETLSFGEDIAFSLVARERGVAVAVVPETTHLYRLHARNSVKGRGARELNVMRVLHESLNRRAGRRGVGAAALPGLDRAARSGSTE